MPLAGLATPSLLLDIARLEANCARMIRRCRELGTRLRPHMKTMKSIDVARLAIDPEHRGITVSTLHEAAYFADHGLSDILYAVCITPDKFDRAAEIAGCTGRLGLFIDDAAVAADLARFSERTGARFDCWVEIDSGEHRTGVLPHAPQLTDMAAILEAAPNLAFRGVATHAGHAYDANSAEEIRAIAQEERQAVLVAADRLRCSGIPCRETSIGSTPTAMFLEQAEGISEIRAGVYQSGDLVQWSLGSCGIEDIALSVLATVISQQRSTGKIVIDAGGLALSKDEGTGRHGYGLVLDERGEDRLGSACVARVYQEHGEIHDVPEALFDRLPVGSRVRVLPNHACMTAAMYEDFQLVGPAGRHLGSWSRTNGWR
jgi:D-serine deaminase-like pyridoxal phosphate-dependent protein